MVSCKKCGAEISKNDKVCPECGVTVEDAQNSALMITIALILLVIFVIWLLSSYFNIIDYLMSGM
jgi:predicted nucleic acid-binding Zn ribbon protein